jgi:DNA (cytosine-5)-methyltransferase 1
MGKLKTISLFSGCGGADLGATKAGAEIIFWNDKNKDAVATYNKYKEKIISSVVEVIPKDIHQIKSFPSCDLVMGCYPCQSFTMGGPRSPEDDQRTTLFEEFARCVDLTKCSYFITENVAGLVWLSGGRYLRNQLKAFTEIGNGYNLSVELVNAKDFGVPQDRKRVIIVGVRKDFGVHYHFPQPSHGPSSPTLSPYTSHGDTIESLFDKASGEFYDYPSEPFSWWYLSRNRKRSWEGPSYAIPANWRHVPLHPASPAMSMAWSRLNDGFKQGWEFTETYDHIIGHAERPVLEKPRRLSWRECAAIQGFPSWFEPQGSILSKYRQIGNATPPRLMEVLVKGLIKQDSLRNEPYKPENIRLT